MKGNGQKPAAPKNSSSSKGKDNSAQNKKMLELESFDWERMRLRLSTLGTSQEETIDTLSPEEVEQVWVERANEMAHAAETETLSEQLEVVLLRVGRELLGVEVDYVTAIRQNEPLTRVPRVPAWVAGVVNLRGSILSVIDLRAFLGLPAALHEDHADGPTDRKAGLMVVTSSREMQVVLLVDDVPGVETLNVRDIHVENNILRGLRPEYVRGIFDHHTSVDGEERADPVIILNIEVLLSDRRLVIYEEPA